MKKILNLFFVLISAISLGYTAEDVQPPITTEMTQLGLTPFPARKETIQRTYLVDDKRWEENLTKARNRFSEIEQMKCKNGETKELIPLYWNLSQHYDYGPANKTLCFSFTAGDFGLKENVDWGLFFGSRPQDEYDMNLKRRICLSNAELSDDDEIENPRELHEKSGHSSSAEETFANDSFGSEGSTPPTNYSDNEYKKTYNLSQMIAIEKSIKLCKKGNEVEETRIILNYLKDGLKWTQKEIAEKFKVSESSMTNFFKYNKNPLCLIDAVRYFYKNNPDISLVSPPVVVETHWYDVFFSRPDSGSSSSSKESNRSAAYLERETLIKKDK
jgi:hypothetical protein